MNDIGYYVLNLETSKLELHFDKTAYDALDDAQKGKIRSAFLWSGRSKCWVSRAKEPNLWRAEGIAKDIGLENKGKEGERISFAEQLERKQERAEERAERYEGYAQNAEKRGESLQKPLDSMHGDIAFFTQPNINSSAGRAFTRQREKMYAAYERGLKEFNKSEYYRDRAETARITANKSELQNKGFVCRRIKESDKVVRDLKKAVDAQTAMVQRIEAGETLKRYGGEVITLEQAQERLETLHDRLEVGLDKLGFYQDCLDALGGVTFSQENIKPGYIIKASQWGVCRVVSTGPKNLSIALSAGVVGITYAEILAVVEMKEESLEAHPFKVGDSFECKRWSGEKRCFENVVFKIIRTTEVSVTLQVEGEKPFVRKPKRVTLQTGWHWRLSITDSNSGTVYKERQKKDAV